MLELELEAHKLGIPVKTRHNEVAPNQFELAPIFEETNLANDHNLLIMSLMKEIANKHNFRVLLHEKPFAGINGSGKHNNWSLGTDKGQILFSPGKDPVTNLQFLTFIVNVMFAVYKHNALVKASIMDASNAHRLGGNEAPPAIISMFMGSQLSAVLDKIQNSSLEDLSISGKDEFNLNLAQVPELRLDNTDRNRTSPFAFTGNRFEFRAVGSSSNCASAMIVLNSAVADSLNMFADRVEERMRTGERKESAILNEVKNMVAESEAIRFDGNGYTEEWKIEAARRGLDTETSGPVIYDAYLKPENVAMFERTGIFTKKEIEARNEVKWEMYSKKIQIESRVLGDLALNHIIPAAIKYQNLLLDNTFKLQQIFNGDEADTLSRQDCETIKIIAENIDGIKKDIKQMTDSRHIANRISNEREKAVAYHDTVVPVMEKIRLKIDKLEQMVDNEIWPLPKYREMLFIR